MREIDIGISLRPRGGRRFWVLVAAAVVVVLAAVIAVVATTGGDDDPVTERSMTVSGVPEAGQPVSLDASVFLPRTQPAPAVVLAHGFGGSKADLAAQARTLAGRGYVVITYSARGFGASGGLIHLDNPDYEVGDARRIIDLLATMPQVERDAPGDPRVGVAGSSYGGALALLTAGYDRRVDAVAADITWNDLSQALFPVGTDAPGATGVFKQQWAGQLFSQAARMATSDGCGKFAPDVCAAYQASAAAGAPDANLQALMRASSPSSILGRITAPTLLIQGQQDSLFPIDQAVRNAAGIRAAGTPVRMQWRTGGHDQPGGDITPSVESWFATALQDRKTPDSGFAADVPDGALSTDTGRSSARQLTASTLAEAQRSRDVTLQGPEQTVNAPAGGTPSAITAVPGIGSLLSAAAAATGAGALSAIPGQVAGFVSSPLDADTLVGGSSSVRLRITPRTTTDATVFVSLVDVASDGQRTQPSGLVTPIRLTGLTPGQPTSVTVPLPTVVRSVASGHRLAVAVSTTDLGYRLPVDARTYSVALESPTLTLTTLTGRAESTPFPWGWPVAGVIALLVLIAGISVATWRRRAPGDAATVGKGVSPIVVESLSKEYGDSYRAVDDVSFRVEAGQVVGLLGPNGAGKTTVLRMMVGLISPTSGHIRLFGEEVRAGSSVLARVGAFIEGPGLLPHLSGRQNLDLYWAATGRSAEEADFETALEIAGLGASVDRKVRKYSQGMRQRLAIAQAMLGLPELLILDEPTNGLDPPQIAEMREVMRRYAATGRTVVVSSHLLSEVEQTCSHVVVMHKGRLITAGSVDELAGAATSTLAVDDVAAAQRVLEAAGVRAEVVESRRHLEEAFLDLIGDESR
ncbi:alpha/beta fold hydrolase [Williamsia maris]|uniref:ABC-2 type transport system ATP-binding protein n=1 Tax=Williamsia maris TaxID=72806 RepID=A0ABT1HD60_9NOCA|nr:alpha/beta fold hydrolase [Williamsia maris]MCP2175608.1 ABC-2 type transport system ATP-binding protein [Williamsia maris]